MFAIALCFCVSVVLLAIDGVLASASRPRLHAKGEAGDAAAAAAAAVLERRDVLGAALRLANLACTIFATALATSVLEDHWGKKGVPRLRRRRPRSVRPGARPVTRGADTRPPTASPR